MKRNSVKEIKELIEAKIIYFRKLQQKASIEGKFDRAEMFKFYRWSLEELLEEINDKGFDYVEFYNTYKGVK